MDYKKLHKETLQGLQKLVVEGKITEDVAKQICPDFVAENEDERIRKDIVANIKEMQPQLIQSAYGYTKEQMLNWLEKHRYTEEDTDKAYKNFDEIQYQKESKDDRIRMWLVRLISTARFNDIESDPCPGRSKVLDWLEKQKIAEWREEEVDKLVQARNR